MSCVAVKNFPLRLPNKWISFTRNNIRLCSNAADNPNDATSTKIPLGSTTTALVKSKNTAKPVEEKKLIKVAIIGAPNAGKSSFVNQLSNRRVSKHFGGIYQTFEFDTYVFNHFRYVRHRIKFTQRKNSRKRFATTMNHK